MHVVVVAVSFSGEMGLWTDAIGSTKSCRNVFFFPPSKFFFICLRYIFIFDLKRSGSLFERSRHLIVQWSMLLLLQHVSTATAVYLRSLPALFLNLHLSKHPEKELLVQHDFSSLPAR
jgi:hypothetical protein